jgi:hypothetical protein
MKCPNCGSTNLMHYHYEYLCLDCRKLWSKIMGRILQSSESLTKEEFDNLLKKWKKEDTKYTKELKAKWESWGIGR